MKLTRIILATLVVALTAAFASAQDNKQLTSDEQDMYLISAKAGVVNIIEGDVTVKGEKAGWERLIAGDDLREGDTVKTGANGRVEILLNPGSYLRLAENSELVYADSFMGGLKVKLLRGSAIVEASALDGHIMVNTPTAKFAIVKVGLYRFNVGEDGKSEVAVRDGRVVHGLALARGGKKMAVENGQPVIAKFDKKIVDSFDTWSKDRAKTLIAANKKLSQKAMKRNGALTSLFSVWVYDRSCGCRTWLPGWTGFSSPYGGSYSNCNPYWARFNPWRYNNGGYYGGGSNGGGGGTSGGGGISGGGGGRSGGGGSAPIQGSRPTITERKVDVGRPSGEGRPPLN
jgi:FecR protein